MKTTATNLRSHLYQLLDQLIATGEPIEIERRGHILKIIAEEAPSKLARLKPRPTLNGSPQDVVSPDWSGLWQPDKGFKDVP